MTIQKDTRSKKEKSVHNVKGRRIAFLLGFIFNNADRQQEKELKDLEATGKSWGI
jgi:hypothetical protein